MKKVFFTLALLACLSLQANEGITSTMDNNGYCPENYSRIQTNCGPQCWTTVEITPITGGLGVLITRREPTDSEALLYQSFANAQCAQDNSLEPKP